MRILLFFLLLNGASLFSEEIQYDFSNDAGILYNRDLLEVSRGRLSLSLTGFWTNTGLITNLAVPVFLFQDSRGDLFYDCEDNTFLGGNLYRSTNHGAVWERVDSEEGYRMLEDDNHDLYYSISWSMGFSSVRKSYNEGEAWSVVSPLQKGFHGLLMDRNNTLYASGYTFWGAPLYSTNRVYKSFDHGTNWSVIYKEGITTAQELIGFYWMHETESGALLAGRFGKDALPFGLCVSTNAGTNWSLILSTSNKDYTRGIVQASDQGFYAFGPSGIIKSFDEGRTWQNVSSETCLGLIEADNGIFYRSMKSNIWKSCDRGSTWQKTPDLRHNNIPYGRFPGRALIQADDRRIYAGAAFDKTNGFVFRSAYVTSATAQFLFAPSSVIRYFSSSRSEALNGCGIQYDFAFSRDRGETWSAWAPLSDEALQSVECGGNGDDRLKVRAVLSSPDHERSPELDSFTLSYDDGSGTGLGSIVLAPNPLRCVSARDGVTFFNAPKEFSLAVFSMAGGMLLQSEGIRTTAGKYFWEPRNSSGEPLKSGTYLCRLTDTEGAGRYFKLVIIR